MSECCVTNYHQLCGPKGVYVFYICGLTNSNPSELTLAWIWHRGKFGDKTSCSAPALYWFIYIGKVCTVSRHKDTCLRIDTLDHLWHVAQGGWSKLRYCNCITMSSTFYQQTLPMYYWPNGHTLLCRLNLDFQQTGFRHVGLAKKIQVKIRYLSLLPLILSERWQNCS